MSELQATVEFLVEFHKFYNVDLFQRGVYQIRAHLRSSPKIAAKIESSLHQGSGRTSSNYSSNALGNILYPACVVNGCFVSQTFQILYRNEDVHLADVALFRLHVLVDSHKIEETLEKADLQLLLELWFSDQDLTSSDPQDRSGGGNGSGIACVSSRTLQLHFSPARSLHYHLPVLFDYFHLAAVSLTIHASLVAIHQPYINAPRSGRSWITNHGRSPSSRLDTSLDPVFFANLTGTKCVGQTGWRLAHARQIHRDVCSLLSVAGDSLRSTMRRFVQLLPETERSSVEVKPSMHASRQGVLGSLDCEEDFIAAANSDIGQLCAENVMLWRQLLDKFIGKDPVRENLAQVHHLNRVKRFSEAFYAVSHPVESALNSSEADMQTCLYITEVLRKSRYLASLPPLPVDCVELNGDLNSLPIIYEDRYEHAEKQSKPQEKPLPAKQEEEQPIYEEINHFCTSTANTVINHVYRSLPQTPLFSSPSQPEVPDARRRSYSGEKQSAKMTRKFSQATVLEGSPKYKIRPLVNSKSSENFDKLRRVATVTPAAKGKVTLVGYKALTKETNNSESLPDLKCTMPKSPRIRITKRNHTVSHSFSDPSLIKNLPKRSIPSPIVTPACRGRTEEMSSTSDSSEQSGWVSSALSSKEASPLRKGETPQRITRVRETEDELPDIVPLAPPEEFQDPPRSKNYVPKLNLSALMHGTKLEVPHEGLPGVYRPIGDDLPSEGPPNSNSKARPRPLNQQELRLLQLLLYEMCRPGQPNPLIRALSQSLYESLALSLSLSQEGASSQPKVTDNPSVAHSASLPCLRRDSSEASASSDTPDKTRALKHCPLTNQRSISLSNLQQQDTNPSSCDCESEERIQQRLVSMLGDGTLSFLKAKEDFKRQIHFNGILYSDMPRAFTTLPYFQIPDEMRPFSSEGLHLIVCVHGLDGNSADLRLVKTYLELALPGANLDFLMSERNQGGTFSTFEVMTERLVTEILYYIEANNLEPQRISFVGHSLGTIIIRSALTRPQMRPFLPKLHTFLSLSGPHLGTLYNSSGLVNMGLWLMQRWKKSGSLQQLSLKDSDNPRQAFLYRLAHTSQLHRFRNVILCGSAQDRYVPRHSARIELCRSALRDLTIHGAAYQEMVHHILNPLISSKEVTLVRYDIHHALPSTANALIGRAAHIAVLDSELFLEKFLLVTGAQYFR